MTKPSSGRLGGIWISVVGESSTSQRLTCTELNGKKRHDKTRYFLKIYLQFYLWSTAFSSFTFNSKFGFVILKIIIINICKPHIVTSDGIPWSSKYRIHRVRKKLPNNFSLAELILHFLRHTISFIWFNTIRAFFFSFINFRWAFYSKFACCIRKNCEKCRDFWPKKVRILLQFQQGQFKPRSVLKGMWYLIFTCWDLFLAPYHIDI